MRKVKKDYCDFDTRELIFITDRIGMILLAERSTTYERNAHKELALNMYSPWEADKSKLALNSTCYQYDFSQPRKISFVFGLW